MAASAAAAGSGATGGAGMAGAAESGHPPNAAPASEPPPPGFGESGPGADARWPDCTPQAGLLLMPGPRPHCPIAPPLPLHLGSAWGIPSSPRHSRTHGLTVQLVLAFHLFPPASQMVPQIPPLPPNVRDWAVSPHKGIRVSQTQVMEVGNRASKASGAKRTGFLFYKKYPTKNTHIF